MEIIVSHSNTDFDGLAAMIAAKKLYPRAQLVFVGKLTRNVEEFMVLHKDTLGIRNLKDIPLEAVKKVICVDTKSPKRLGALQKLFAQRQDLEVHIYDHHPPTDDDLSGTIEVVAYTGACTTLLVELIREACLELNSFDATILALGIYEDTGCLTFSTTTARDANAVAYLIEQGAKVTVIADFIERPLTDQQKQLLNALILSTQHYMITGVKVVVAKTSIDEFVGGLALLTHKLADIERVDLILSVVEMEDRIHIVGRSRSDNVDVGNILEDFGGGGHAKAASATVKAMDIDMVCRQLHEVLHQKIKPMITARQLMSAPVKTVFIDTTIDEAGKIMLRYGHSGLPVVDRDLNIVGIISRRDVDKAQHHGLGHAPVKGYMSRSVVAVEPDKSLQEIQRILIEHNIGRVPVIKDKQLLGIVSRTDVLRHLHGKSYPEKYRTIYLSDPESGQTEQKTIRDLMVERLPEHIRDLLGRISYVADKEKVNAFVVGGFVRDLLLNLENFDIDLVVEGDGAGFAKVLAEYFCGRVRVHEKFGTAVVILPDGFKIDVATARTEYYEYPAALPKVETSSLKQDLYRRDFTINAMAIALGHKHFGELIDYFGGRRDLEKKVVRVLYNLSFVEDPTRIFRAIRFEQRYGFGMEPQTLELAVRAINDNWLGKLSYERIREELKHIFDEAYPIKAITRMKSLGLWQFVLPEVEINTEIKRVVDSLPMTNAMVRGKLIHADDFRPWLTYLVALVHTSEPEVAQKIFARFRLTKEENSIVTATRDNWYRVIATLTSHPNINLGVIARETRELPYETFAFILAKLSDIKTKLAIESYLEHKRTTKLAIGGMDLKALGLPHGPAFAKILTAVYDAKLDGIVKSREEELELAEKLIKQELERRNYGGV